MGQPRSQIQMSDKSVVTERSPVFARKTLRNSLRSGTDEGVRPYIQIEKPRLGARRGLFF